MRTNQFDRELPEGLEGLVDLATDLRWTGSLMATKLWRQLDQDAWDRSNNPYTILMNVHQARLEEAARDHDLKASLAHLVARRREYLESRGWFGERYPTAPLNRVAYFSMEFGLGEALPIYSGGLGILAGDHLKSASDLGVPVIGIGILYQQGYFRQVLGEDGEQHDAFPYNDPGNNPWDRAITAHLYAAGQETRLLQELVLGVGGWRLLEKLGLEPEICHLNEGHAAFAVLARAQSFARQNGLSFAAALRATRAGNVFTTHTPVDAAFDRFPPALLMKYVQPFLESTGMPIDAILALGRKNAGDRDEAFNMAYLAMRGCSRVNGVARLHGRVGRKLFNVLFPSWPEAEVPVSHVTNGVHLPTWDGEAANQLWRRAYPSRSWLEHLIDASHALVNVSPLDLWTFRAHARTSLVEYVRLRLERQVREAGASPDAIRRARHVLDPNCLTLGFARRFAPYKRPTLFLHDPQWLIRLLNHPTRPLQIVIAGKAHPNDDLGKSLVRAVSEFVRRPEVRDRVVFLQDYDMVLGNQMAAGVDVWLNNPRRPSEACGTSGMKVLANGGLNVSILDGWWDEAFTPEVGWAIGGREEHSGEKDAWEAEELYRLIEQEIVPAFYERDAEGIPQAWVGRVRASMMITPQFSSDRMVREYTENVYLPAARALRARASESTRRALDCWFEQIDEGWEDLRCGDMQVKRNSDQLEFEVQVYLGSLPPDFVKVELYCDPDDGALPQPVPMTNKGPIPGAVNGYFYEACVPAERPSEHYTPRIIPHHDGVCIPMENARIHWGRK